jgi:hypothetical protein
LTGRREMRRLKGKNFERVERKKNIRRRREKKYLEVNKSRKRTGKQQIMGVRTEEIYTATCH